MANTMSASGTVTQKFDETQDQSDTVATKIVEDVQAAVRGVSEFGSEALDKTDEWLKPVGLSLKSNPVVTLAIVGGAAAVIGALWMSRAQPTRSQRVSDELARLMRRAGL